MLDFVCGAGQDNLDVIDRLIDDAEAQYRNFQHPDPYIGKRCFNPGSFCSCG